MDQRVSGASEQAPPSLLLTVGVRDGRWAVHGEDPSWPIGALPGLGAWLVRRVHTHVREAGAVTLVHAGAVTGPRGAVLLPGRSGSGKSTLVSQCVRDGAGYLTDELVAVGLDGKLTGAGMPLNLKPGSRELLPWVDTDGPLPATAVRPASAETSADLVAIVGLSPHASGGHPISRRDALLATLQVTVPATDQPDRGLGLLAPLVKHAECAVLGRGDMRSAARTILDLAGVPVA